MTLPITPSIVEVNASPRFTTRPARTALVGQLYAYHVGAEDPDDPSGVSLAFVPVSLPGDMGFDDTIGPTSLLSWMPTPADAVAGSVFVEIAVTDGEHVVADAFRVRVYAGSDANNHAPIIDRDYPPVTVARYRDMASTYGFQLVAHDPDGDDLTYDLYVYPTPTPYTPSVSNKGRVFWQLDETNIDQLYWFTVYVRDPGGAFDWVNYSLNVYGTDNIPPTIISTPVQEVELGDTYIYRVEATDPDLVAGAHLNFELVPAPDGGRTDAVANWPVRWCPEYQA
jgi:hypothetical protein